LSLKRQLTQITATDAESKQDTFVEAPEFDRETYLMSMFDKVPISQVPLENQINELSLFPIKIDGRDVLNYLAAIEEENVRSLAEQ